MVDFVSINKNGPDSNFFYSVTFHRMPAMKIALLICWITFLLCNPFLKADPLLQPNDRVAICGDSISDYLEDYLLMAQPVAGLDIAQFNWVAQGPAGLLARLNTDLLPYKPTVVLLGFNGGDKSRPSSEQQHASGGGRRLNLRIAGGVRANVLVFGHITEGVHLLGHALIIRQLTILVKMKMPIPISFHSVPPLNVPTR